MLVAEDCIAEGNQNFQNELSNPKVSREKIQQVQSMTEMDLDRKQNLESKIKDLENEKAKITKKWLKVFSVLKFMIFFCCFKLCQGFDSRYIVVLLSLP